MHALNLENPVLLFSRLRKNKNILFLLFIILDLALLHIYTKSQNVPSYFHLVPSLNPLSLRLCDFTDLCICVFKHRGHHGAGTRITLHLTRFPKRLVRILRVQEYKLNPYKSPSTFVIFI